VKKKKEILHHTKEIEFSKKAPATMIGIGLAAGDHYSSALPC